MLRAALNDLASIAPEWLREHAAPEWFDRYSTCIEDYRLPKGREAREEYAELIGADGSRLLTALYDPSAPPQLRQRASRSRRCGKPGCFNTTQRKVGYAGAKPTISLLLVSALIRPMTQKHVLVINARSPGPVTKFISPKPVRTRRSISSPMLKRLLLGSSIVRRSLLFRRHWPKERSFPANTRLHSGYVDADVLVKSQRNLDLEIIGPMRPDSSWQAKAGQGYDLSHFSIHWPTQRVTCPQGKLNTCWVEHLDSGGNPAITVKFSATDCRPCPARSLCTKSKAFTRNLTFRAKTDHETDAPTSPVTNHS